MRTGCGQRRMNLAAPYFSSPYRAPKTPDEFPRPECPLLALSGHALLRCTSPFLTQSGRSVAPHISLMSQSKWTSEGDSDVGASQLFFSRKAVQARYFGRLVRDRFEFGTSPSS